MEARAGESVPGRRVRGFNLFQAEMMKQLRFRILAGAALAGAAAVAGCFGGPGGAAAERGLLRGTVTIGPLCPAERTPPDPRCRPTEATYAAWPIAVYRADRSSTLAPIEPGPGGAYEVELPAGTYVVDLERPRPYGPGGGNLPQAVVIRADETTVLDIDIDTGIR